MDKTRLEAFSDAVIAVAITLLVIDLRVPETGEGLDLGHRLAEMWPNFAAYVVSFLTIGVIWLNHHATLRRLRAADRAILLVNIVLLMTIVILPFTTALFARYLTEESGHTLAAALYAGSLLLMSAVFYGFNWLLLARRAHLLHEEVTEPYRRTVMVRNLIGVVPYVLATVGAFVSPYVTLVICAVVAVYFMLPAATPEAPSRPAG